MSRIISAKHRSKPSRAPSAKPRRERAATRFCRPRDCWSNAPHVAMIGAERVTITEFDRWVETADESFAYELRDGVVYSFASGTVVHGRLCTRLGVWLHHVVEPPCEVFLGLLPVRQHPERPSSVIPDVLVTCEEPSLSQMYVTSPKLVVEVLSSTSVVNDFIRKPQVYEAASSIEELLLVDSRTMWARVFRRDDAASSKWRVRGSRPPIPRSNFDLSNSRSPSPNSTTVFSNPPNARSSRETP